MPTVPCAKCAPLVHRLRAQLRALHERGLTRKEQQRWRDQEIVRRRALGHTYAAIARDLGMTRGGVYNVVLRLRAR